MIFIKPRELKNRNDITNRFQKIIILDGFSISPGNINRKSYIFTTKDITINNLFEEKFLWVSKIYNSITHHDLSQINKYSSIRMRNKKIETMEYKQLQLVYKYCYFLAASVYIHKNIDNKDLSSEIKKINNSIDLLKVVHKKTIIANMNKYLSIFYNIAKDSLENKNYKITLFSMYSLAEKIIIKNLKNFKINKKLNKNSKLSDFFKYKTFNPLGEYLGVEYEKKITQLLNFKKTNLESQISIFLEKSKAFPEIKRIDEMIVIPIDGEIIVRNNHQRCPDFFFLINYEYLIAADIKINPKRLFKSRKSQVSYHNVERLIRGNRLLSYLFY